MNLYLAGLIGDQMKDLNSAMDKAGKMNNAFSKIFGEPKPEILQYEWIEDIMTDYVKRVNTSYGSIDEDDLTSIAKDISRVFERCHKDEYCSGKCVIKEDK